MSNTRSNTGQHKRSSSVALSPQHVNKNRYAPLSNLNDKDDVNTEITDMDIEEVKQKMTPLYIYEINDYIAFLNKISPVITADFNLHNKNIFLKLNLSTVDDYRSVTKYFSENNIKYHTYQLPEDRNISIIIRNLPTSISEAEIYEELSVLKCNVTSVTRLQNRHKSPIPIVAVILDKSEKNIFSLDRLLQCIITVENRKTDNSIPQCQNCQRFNHTKNFCKLPPRCVKCPEQHHYSECTKDRNSPPTCVNCNENHPANYKGCKIYKQIKNHSKAKSHKDPPKHLQTILEPKEQNAFQPYIRSQTINTQSESYAAKAKTNLSKKEVTVDDQSNSSNITNELIKSPDILDVVLLKSTSLIINEKPLFELDSDHLPLKILIGASLIQSEPTRKLINGKPDWNKFKRYVSDNIIIPKNISNTLLADVAISHLHETISYAAEQCTIPSKPTLGQNYKSKITPSIQKIIKNKHHIRKQWQLYRRPGDRKKLNFLTKKVKLRLEEHRINSYQKYLSSIHPANSNLWLATKRLIKPNDNKIPPLKSGNNFINTVYEKCNLFASTLENTFTLNDLNDNATINLVSQKLSEPEILPQNIFPYTNPTEIIKKLPNRKSPALFNALLKLSYFPTNWKLATIIMIKKPGKDNTDPNNYRPISLLSSVSKIFEKIIHTSLISHLNAIDAILHCQFGFKLNHSTTQQLLRITEHISNGCEKKEHTGAAFLDIAKRSTRSGMTDYFIN
ncbi:hypothetical protein QTP88_005280 [Uroleucon formosanum]